MDSVKNLLFDKKNEINASFDSLLSTVKSIMDRKNKEIFSLKKEIEILTSKKINDNNIKNKIFISKIIFNELLISKNNNKLFKKTIKAEIKSNKVKIKYNDKINQIKSEYNEKLNSNENKINTKDMTAFKIIAMELEEKEKINKDCFTTIDKLKIENKNLKNNIEAFTKENEVLKNKIIILNEKNLNLVNLNKSQLNTIETLTKEMKNKSEKISDLKNYFLEILDNYNNIIQEME